MHYSQYTDHHTKCPPIRDLHHREAFLVEWVIGVTSSVLATVLIFAAGRAYGLAATTTRRRSSEKRLYGRLRDAGFSNFFLTRSDYGRYRGTPSLTEYLGMANKSVIVVGYWLAQGNEIENVAVEIGQLIVTRPEFTVGIAVIDPDSASSEHVAGHLGLPAEDVQERARSTLRNLSDVKRSLPVAAQDRLTLKTYRTTPVASVIILDGEEPYGRIQLDFKPYRAPRSQTFGFELSGRGHPLYDTCLQSWGRLFKESPLFDERRLV